MRQIAAPESIAHSEQARLLRLGRLGLSGPVRPVVDPTALESPDADSARTDADGDPAHDQQRVREALHRLRHAPRPSLDCSPLRCRDRRDRARLQDDDPRLALSNAMVRQKNVLATMAQSFGRPRVAPLIRARLQPEPHWRRRADRRLRAGLPRGPALGFDQPLRRHHPPRPCSRHTG